MKEKPCRKSFGSNRAGKVFLNGSPCLSQLPCFTICPDVPMGCDMLPSGVPTGGQDSWGQLRDLQECCEQPRYSQEPWCLAGGLLDIWDVTKSLLWGVQLMWVLRCLLRKV